jgi:hypothetical protein
MDAIDLTLKCPSDCKPQLHERRPMARAIEEILADHPRSGEFRAPPRASGDQFTIAP